MNQSTRQCKRADLETKSIHIKLQPGKKNIKIESPRRLQITRADYFLSMTHTMNAMTEINIIKNQTTFLDELAVGGETNEVDNWLIREIISQWEVA